MATGIRMLHPILEEAFDDLLVAWRHHSERRAGRAPLPALAQTRERLDHARDRMHRIRRALSPEEREAGEATAVIPCPTLDTVVVLYRGDGDRCLCGDALPAAP